ncbi:MAG: GNAT family N-acetyltransferase [Jatrophihabitantaceae bacterium]
MPELASPAVPAGRLRDQEQPTLHVDELTLRPWRLSDAPAVAAVYHFPEIQQWHVRSMDEDEARDWVASRSRHWTAETGADWAVTRDGELVARTGFRLVNLDEAFAEAAYWTAPAARGGGIAVRALRAASSWMLTTAGLHRLELLHSVANPASCRVAVKAGYRYEGTRRQYTLHADGWHDMHTHGLLAKDLPE